MQLFVADIEVPDDDELDYGEGGLSFTWPDPIHGTEGLIIDLAGHCSRIMPIRSRQGPPCFVELGRDHIKMRFSPALAKNLELDEEIEIKFAINDQDFGRLKGTLDYLMTGNAPENNSRANQRESVWPCIRHTFSRSTTDDSPPFHAR